MGPKISGAPGSLIEADGLEIDSQHLQLHMIALLTHINVAQPWEHNSFL